MPRFSSTQAALLHRRATPASPSTPSPLSNDANVALVAIIASASFIFLLMLACVCRSLRRHPAQPGCLHWFMGRATPHPAVAHQGTSAAAAGTGTRRLSVIQDEITREYYRRSAIMAVAGPRGGGGGQVGFASSGWDPSKPPSEVFTPPPAYLPDRPMSFHELPMAASSSQAIRSARSSVTRGDPLPESPTAATPLPASASSTARRPRPQTIDDVLGLAATSPDLRTADPPPPAYAPFSDIPLVDMMDGGDDDNVPVGHGAGQQPYLAGHVNFAHQHDGARGHRQHQDHPQEPHRQERGPQSNHPTFM